MTAPACYPVTNLKLQIAISLNRDFPIVWDSSGKMLFLRSPIRPDNSNLAKPLAV